MKKIASACMFVVAMLYSTTTYSRICFLADVECQAGIGIDNIEITGGIECLKENSSYIVEHRLCETNTHEYMCNDVTGNYYTVTGCIAGYTDMSLEENSSIFDCEVGLSCDRCCPNNKVKCKKEFKLCYSPTFPPTDAKTCLEPGKEDYETRYDKCFCNAEEYKYSKSNCGHEGLKQTGSYCKGDNTGGQNWYTECVCADGFSKTNLINIGCPDACQYDCSSIGTSVKLPDSSYYCWNGATCAPKPDVKDPCTNPHTSNFDYYWVGYDVVETCKNLTVDCELLGYNTGRASANVTCKDKSEPYRCVFDHEQVYCKSGLCTYETKALCESANTNYVCELVHGATDPASWKDCYEATKCKTGHKKVAKNCVECSWKTQSACESANANYVCAELSGYPNCWETTGCKVNYCETGSACDTVCASKYKYYSGNKPANSTLTGDTCQGYTGVSAGTCNSTNELRYTSFECNRGYVKNAAGTACDVAQCPTDSSTSYSNVSNCGYPSTTGASVSGNGSYSADKECYKCSCACGSEYKWEEGKQGEGTLSDQCCNGKYKTCNSTCNAVTVPDNAHSTKTCDACGNETVDTAWECNENYTKNSQGTECCIYAAKNTCQAAYPYSACGTDNKGCYVPTGCKIGYATSVTGCGKGGADGWSLGEPDDNGCGKCTMLTCELPSSSAYNSNAACQTELGAPTTTGISFTPTGKFEGNSPCYKCSCTCGEEYKWGKGQMNAEVSDQCCNGKYKTCKSTCVAVTVPTNAHATASCVACDDAPVTTAWECNDGYTKSGDKCVLSVCPDTSSSSYTDTSKCGYPATTGASVTLTGVTSATGACYKCSCSCDSSTYKWDSSNKGDKGVLGTQCCNGKYTCTKNFPTAVNVPDNATGSSESFTACGETKSITTSWSCNNGYTKSGNTCVISTCPTGSSTIYKEVSKCGYPTTTGASVAKTGVTSANGDCYKCSCSCDSSTYKWDSSNKGDKGVLGTQCCNGKYTCTKDFPTAVNVPDNATGSSESFTACGETKSITTSWSCNDGYTKSGNTCVPAGCPTGTSTDYTDVSKCGYPSTIGAKVLATDSVSGGKTCYECMCTASCKWTSSNKDTYGTISNVCCNGKYQTCTKNFPIDVAVPTGATAKTTSYKACGETKNVITGWECTGQYVKNGNLCYDCATKKTLLDGYVKTASHTYGACCYTTGTEWNPSDKTENNMNNAWTCRSAAACSSNYPGWYGDGCLPHAKQQSSNTPLTPVQVCYAMFDDISSQITTHNKLCPASYQVSGTVNRNQCNTIISNGNPGVPVESMDGSGYCVPKNCTIGCGKSGTGGTSSGGGGSSSGGSAIITPQVPSLDVRY